MFPEELYFAESVCKALKQAHAVKRKGRSDPRELFPLLMPDVSPEELAHVAPWLGEHTKEDTAIMQDPAGWVAAHFPTNAALRSAHTACSNGTVARIIASRVRALNAAKVLEPPLDTSSEDSAVGFPQVTPNELVLSDFADSFDPPRMQLS
ncbi:hypothetical protein DIPPA_22678 [Diplonema papillatum]|nr:hypothetical protein DIPPA_22678 [Diplonema papillatum]